MDVMNLLPSRDFSYETLDFIDTFFQKNLSGGKQNNFRELLYSITADSEPDLDKLDDITAFCNKEIESLAKEPIINNMLKKDQNMN